MLSQKHAHFESSVSYKNNYIPIFLGTSKSNIFTLLMNIKKLRLNQNFSANVYNGFLAGTTIHINHFNYPDCNVIICIRKKSVFLRLKKIEDRLLRSLSKNIFSKITLEIKNES